MSRPLLNNPPSAHWSRQCYPFLDEPIAESLSTDSDTCISSRRSQPPSDGASACASLNPQAARSDGAGPSLKEEFRSFFQLSRSKQAVTLPRTLQALDKKDRDRSGAGWIIHPCSRFRMCWDGLMVLLLIASVVEVPVVISFFTDDLRQGFVTLHCLLDALLLLDVMVNFRTGIFLNCYVEEILSSPPQIAEYYAKTWFLFDAVSSIPMDYIFMTFNLSGDGQLVHAGARLRNLRNIKILGLMRLFRMSRLIRYIRHLQEVLNISHKFTGTVNIILLILLLSHWNACLQFLVPLLQNFPQESWVTKCNLVDAPIWDQYTWSLLNAVSHMMSIGYGRYPPTSTTEAWLTIVSVLTGVTCYALFVGHAAALMYSLDTSKRLYNDKFKQIREYMTYMKLPKDLRRKIVNYYECRYKGKIFNESNILEELSECLREEIINYNCRDIIATVPIFSEADPNFISDVVVKLKYEVYQPGDKIIKEGTIGRKMYFLLDGTVDVSSKTKNVITTLSNGSFFGEICLLTKSRRVASIVARTNCSIYSLDQNSFRSVLDDYPMVQEYLEMVAAERMKSVGKFSLALKH